MRERGRGGIRRRLRESEPDAGGQDVAGADVVAWRRGGSDEFDVT